MNLKKVFFNNSFKNTSYILKSDLTNESIIIDVPEDPYPIIDNISGLDIKLILLTHHHLDHAGGIDILKQHTNAPVALGVEDVGSKPDDRVAHINPDIEIKNGDTFDLGNEKISTISVPGHTNGSNCFLINKSLFTGDVIFPGRAGRTDSVEQFDLSVKSLKNTLYLLDDDIEFFPGHGKGGETLKDFRNQFDSFLSKTYKEGLYGVVWWVDGYEEEW